MTLANVYTPKFCEVWLRLLHEGDDLYIAPVKVTDRIGIVPSWLEFEMDTGGWDTIISPDAVVDSFGSRWMTWALREGLCPHQPFLIRLEEPEYYRCSYEYNEWDVNYSWRIIAREQRSQTQIIMAWHRFVARRRRLLQEQELRRRDLQEKRRHDISQMYIRYSSYWSNDIWGAPDGEIVALCSKHGNWPLAEGRDHTAPGDRRRAVAWEKMLAQVRKKLPHLDVYVIRELPSRHS